MQHRRSVVLVVVTAVLAALLGASSAGSAVAATAETWPVPPSATITIQGRGFGHGHGLSQYGAEGAARKGLTYRQILKFYYPGTSWGTAAGAVKVLISRDTTDDVVVGPRSGLTVRSLGAGARTWTLPVRRDGKPVKRWRVTPASGHRSTLAYRTGSWHIWRVVAGDAQFAAGGQPVRLYTPAGGVQYRGTLRSATVPSTVDHPNNGLVRDTVNILPLDSYLRGVVPSEVIASAWQQDAIRAQAVAARTYAAYERAHPKTSYYQICDTAHCQVYGGYSAEYPTSNTAVERTAHQVLLAGGRPAYAQFSASNGGWTSAGDFPYLPAKQDPYDGWSGNPYSTWTRTIDDTAIEQQWPALGNLTSISVDSREQPEAQWGGRVNEMTLTGDSIDADNPVPLTGEDFRSGLGLRSTWFTFTVAPATA